MFDKILSLLDHRERWKLAVLLALAIMSGVAQVVGVGSVMPFVSVLTNPEMIRDSAPLGWAHGLVGRPSTNTFLIMLGTGVLAASVLSNALIAFTQWYTFRFARWNQYRLSLRLLEAYLRRPYVYHLQHNSADAGKNILVETTTFTQQLLIPALQAVSFGVSAVFITAFLIWLSPLAAAVAVGIVGGAYVFVYLGLRRRLRRLGRKRLQANTGRFKAANEAFGAIKEIKAAGREAAFLNRYNPAARRFAQAMAAQQVLSQLPRYLIEVVGISSVLLVVLLLTGAGQDATAIVPLVGVYTIAAFRLLPAFQHIYLGASQLRANAPVLDALSADLVDVAAMEPVSVLPSDTTAHFPFTQAIELRDVTFTYPGNDAPALRRISLTIPHGAAVAFIGETGAGKTTLVDIILGLLDPDEGQVLVDGVTLTDGNLPSWRHAIGYVPQHIYLSDDTVANNIAFGIPHDRIDREAVERAARIANIHDFIVGDLAAGYDTVLGERGVRLSGGQRQRIGIARALYHDPEVLVLDEATSALDDVTETAVQTAINHVAEAKTLIIIAHRLSTVRACDSVFLINHGRIAAVGSYDAVIEQHLRTDGITDRARSMPLANRS